MLFDYPLIQVSSIIMFSLVQFGYIIYFRPFKEKFVLVSEFLGEFCALVTFAASFLLLFFKHGVVVEYIELVIQWNVIGGIGIQVAIVMASFVGTLREFYKSCRNRSKIVRFEVGRVLPLDTKVDTANPKSMRY